MGTSRAEVMKRLKENRDPRGEAHWQSLGPKTAGLKGYGIGLTKLRQMAKQIGRDHELAAQLWTSDVYDAKVLGLLIDDPKQITREQAERQVDEVSGGMLSHVFASCGATLAKTPFAFELACHWMESDDAVRQRCGYGLMYELSKKKVQGMDDKFLIERIQTIEATIHEQDMWVRDAMNVALMGIGKRNAKLNRAAVRAAKRIGKVEIDYGEGNRCEPLDVLKHLTSDHLRKKLKV